MLLGMSIVQSGFGLPVLHPATYQYMMRTAYQDIQLSDEDVPDFAAWQLIAQVREKFIEELKYLRLYSTCYLSNIQECGSCLLGLA